jgi:hypothetical protein
MKHVLVWIPSLMLSALSAMGLMQSPDVVGASEPASQSGLLSGPGAGRAGGPQGDGQGAEAIRAVEGSDRWREMMINRIRAADLGAFEYHSYRISERQLRLAEMLVGRLSKSEYAAQPNGPDFIDLYGFHEAGESGAAIDWAATEKDAFIREKSEYGPFAFSIPLASAYWKTGDPAYMRRWFAIAGDFARNQRLAVEKIPPDRRRMENAPWVSGALPCLQQGGRVMAMVRCLAVFAKSLPAAGDGSKPDWADILRPVRAPAATAALEAIPVDDLAAVVRSLSIEHPRLLLDFYSRPAAPPNQRTQGLTALLTLAALFPEADGMQQVAREAGEAMTEYLANGFYPDGGMLEQSLNYNLVEVEQLRQLGRMLRGNPPPWLPLLADRLRGFDRLIVGISTPMRELPVVGNNTSNPPAAWKGEEVRLRWFHRRSSENPRIDTAGLRFASVAFPYSGFYAMRRDWAWDSPYLFMTNARPARGHKTMDNLAIEVHAYGRPLLVRGGPPPYGLKFLPEDRRGDAPKIEEYFDEQSSFKVNTVLVDGRSQARAGPSATVAYDDPVPGRWHASPAFDLVDGRYGLGYGSPANASAIDSSVAHVRRVVHVRELSCWVVSDAMLCPNDKEREFTEIWKFPPFRDASDGANAPICGFTPEQVVFGDGSIRTTDPSGPNLQLYQFTNLPVTYVKHVGETNPYRGWYARFIGDLVPAVDMYTTWRARGPSLVATLLWPTPGGAAPPVKSFNKGGVENAQDTAAFSAVLKNGDTLAYAESASGPRRLEAVGVRITGELLLVTRQGRAIRGLALGCSEWTDGRYTIRPTDPDFEFVCRTDGGFDVVSPIEVPRGFRWRDDGRGALPNYAAAPPSKALPIVEPVDEAIKK